MTISKAISVLLVEDNEADAFYIEQVLPSPIYGIRHASSLAEAQLVDLDTIDVILLDLSLPDGQGLQTCISMIDFAPTAPIIILTGYDSEALGLAAVKLGAQDYVLKRDINESTLSRSIRYAIERTAWEKGIRQSAIEARHAEAEAREAAANLKLSLKASKTGVWLWDFVKDSITWDDQSAAVFGLEHGTALAGIEEFYNCILLDDRDNAKKTIQNAVDQSIGYQTVFRTQWPDGSVHHIASSGQVIEEPSGMPFRMASICTDQTKQMEQYENAKRLLVLEQHEDFISTLTHDLKNPLIAADRLLKLIIDGGTGQLGVEQRNMLTLIRESNSDMLSLIQNLLEVYRIDDGTPSLDYSPVNMALLAGGCVAQLTAIAEDSGVKLSLNFADGDHTISADLISMRRIFMNLVGNAIKFTVSGGSVVVSGHRLGSTYIVEVEDTGSGIPKHELDLLFRRFSQTVLAKRCGAGTGLGLYLCRQLVEAHGGHINCSSEEGVGSTFKVVLPSEHGV